MQSPASCEAVALCLCCVEHLLYILCTSDGTAFWRTCHSTHKVINFLLYSLFPEQKIALFYFLKHTDGQAGRTDQQCAPLFCWKSSPTQKVEQSGKRLLRRDCPRNVRPLSSFPSSTCGSLLDHRGTAGGARLRRQVPFTVSCGLLLSKVLSRRWYECVVPGISETMKYNPHSPVWLTGP